MRQEIVRPIIKVGNSAGVLLPREWLDGKAKIELVRKPLNVKKDVLEILEPYLEDISGIYLTGSYARGEQTENSDVDVLVITNKINKKILKGKYNIILISKEVAENTLKRKALPIIPMLLEAKTLLNKGLIEDYKKNCALNKRNLEKRIELSKSALLINREMIKLDKEWPSNCSDETAYSLVLNLRTVYIIDMLRNNRQPSTSGIKSLIVKICGSLEAYEGYLRAKNGKKSVEELPVKEANKLYVYISKKLEEIEKWLKEKKD